MVIRQWHIRVVITILLTLIFCWIANPAGYYFLNDDFYHIPLAASGSFVHGTLLRPVSDLTLWTDHLCWGRNAYGYHLTNLFLHLGNTLLVYVFARQLFGRYGEKLAVGIKSWLAALLFLLYAFHSEPVFWIIGRGGSLSTLFFLVACICFMKRDISYGYFVGSLLSFGVGLFAYESIWIFPVIALLLTAADVVYGMGKRDKVWTCAAWVFGVFIIFLLYRSSQAGGLAGPYEMKNVLGGRFSTLLYNYNALFARSFLPPMANGKWFVLIYALVWVLLIFVVVRIKRSGKGGMLHWILAISFLVALTPAVSLGISTHDSESERYIYLSSVFLVLWITEIMSILVGNSRWLTVLLLLLTGVNGYGLWQSSRAYRFGGELAKGSLELADTRDAVNTLYLVNLPAQYRGALIFRYGFEPAARWICPDLKYQRVVVIDKRVVSRKTENFRYREATLNQAGGADVGGRVGLADTVFTFLPGKDMILYWTDSSLMKIRR